MKELEIQTLLVCVGIILRLAAFGMTQSFAGIHEHLIRPVKTHSPLYCG
jgi:hypothetical protein